MSESKRKRIISAISTVACTTCVATTLIAPAFAQTAGGETALRELEALIEMRRELAAQMSEFDRRIEALEVQLGAESAAEADLDAVIVTGDELAVDTTPETWGP